MGDTAVDVCLGSAGSALEVFDCIIEIRNYLLEDFADGSARIVGEVLGEGLGHERHARLVGSELICELETGSKGHVRIGTQSLGLGDHVDGLGVGHVLRIAENERIDVGDHTVRSPVADGRVAVVGVAGRKLAANGEPVVTGIGDQSVGTLEVVAEVDHQELPVIRGGVHLG